MPGHIPGNASWASGQAYRSTRPAPSSRGQASFGSCPSNRSQATPKSSDTSGGSQRTRHSDSECASSATFPVRSFVARRGMAPCPRSFHAPLGWAVAHRSILTRSLARRPVVGSGAMASRRVRSKPRNPLAVMSSSVHTTRPEGCLCIHVLTARAFHHCPRPALRRIEGNGPNPARLHIASSSSSQVVSHTMSRICLSRSR
jgi:hypothetical protein